MHRLLASTVGLALLAAACGGSTEPPIDTSAGQVADTDSGFVFEADLEQRLDDDGGIGLELALDLFASEFGQLPGGDPAAFPSTDPHGATLALMALAGHYGELSDEQRAAFDSVASPGVEGTVLPATVGIRFARQPDSEGYTTLVEIARTEIAARVGTPLDIPITVVTLPGTEHWAFASPLRAGAPAIDGSPDECLVQLWPERLTPGDFTRSVITHEVYHCFQYAAYPVLSRYFDTPPWVTEGQAFWVAAEIVGTQQNWVTFGYKDWLCNPFISLWKRYRGAMGFYATVATNGPGDLWQRLDDMLSLSGEAAVAAAGIPAVDALRFTATGRMNDHGTFEDPWTLTGVGIPDGCVGTARATPEAPWAWQDRVQAFAGGPPFVVDVEGEVVRVDASSAAGAVEFSDGTLLPWSVSFTGLVCLLEDGCKCPDGREIGDLSARGGPVAVAAGGGPGEISAALTPFALDEACKFAPDLPQMKLQGDPTIELIGGACVVDGGDLILSIGYEPSYDARLQADAWPYMNAQMFVRAVPGTWDTGTFYISPVAGGGFRGGDGGLVVTLADDLLSGSFTYLRGSGSFSCPRLLTPEEAAAGYPG